MFRCGPDEGRFHCPRLQGLQTLHLPLREGRRISTSVIQFEDFNDPRYSDSKPLALISQRNMVQRYFIVE